MDTLEQPNPEKVPEKEVGQDEPRGNRLIPSFHCTEPWYESLSCYFSMAVAEALEGMI
jgi:hypothetical protein